MRVSAQLTATTPFLPNPCASPYNPVPSLMFPEFYDSAYLQSALLPAGVGNLFNATSLSISFWLNMAVTGQGQAATILQFGDASNPGRPGSHLNISWTSGDLMVLDIGGGDAVTASGTCSDGTFDCLINTWHLWTFTYTAALGTTTKAIWLDGVQVGIIASSNVLSINTSSPLVLGNQRSSWVTPPGWSTPWMFSTNLNNHLPGYLAQLNVYQRVLSGVEITAMATLGLYTNNSALVLRLTFSEQGGTNVSDSSQASNLTLWFNKVATWFQQQPAWTGLFLSPLCLLTPTSLVVQGPPMSPNCHAVNSPFTVTVTVVDSAGAAVTAWTGGSVSINVTRNGTAYMAPNTTVSPASAAVINGVATFTVTSTTAQSLLVSVVDSGRLLLKPTSTVIAISSLSSLYFQAQTSPSALQGQALSILVYAAACQGFAVASGPFQPALTASLSASVSASHLSPSTPAALTFNSSGWAALSLTDSFNEQVVLSLADTSGRGLTAGPSLTAYWTASSATQLLISTPYPANGSQPAANSFYAGVAVVVPVFAADNVGGAVSSFTGSTTLTVRSSSGLSYSHPVALTNGVGSTTFTGKTPGAHILSLSDSGGTALRLGPTVVLQVVGGRPVSVVFAAMNVTRVNAVQFVPVRLSLQVLDVYGNVAYNASGALNVSSTSWTGRINGGAVAGVVNFTNSQAFFTFNETNSIITPAIVTLYINDTYATGLNVSSVQVVYVQPAMWACPSGTVGSGAVGWNGNSAGVFQNTGDLVNFGQADFSMSVWSYVLADGRNYFASQSYYPPSTYQVVGSTASTMYAGPEQVPEAYGISFVMGWYTSGSSSWSAADYLYNAQFNNTAQWGHWVFTFQAQTQSMSIYFNGLLVAQSGGASWATIAAAQPRGSWQLGIAPITFGTSSKRYGNYYMDDLRVYTRTVTAAEVWAMYAYNAYPNSNGLYMHYAFDEGSGTVFHDSINHFDVPVWNYMAAGATSPYYPSWVGFKPNCQPTTTSLAIVTATSVQLGSPVLITLQALDAFNNPSVSFNGQAQLSISGSSSATLSPSNGVVNFTAGTATLSLSDVLPDNVTLSLVDVNQTGLIMGPSVVVQLFAGALYQLVITSAPSQLAGGSAGSLIVITCQDAYGNHVVQGCAGSVQLLHNSSNMQQPSPLTVTLSSTSGTGTATLNDAAREAVRLWLLDNTGLGVLVSSTATFYSTAAPSQLLASNFSLTAGAIQATVDAAVLVSLTVLDAYNTPCNYATATTLITLSSPSGLATGGGVLSLTQGTGSVNVRDSVAELVQLSFSQSQLLSPSSLPLASPSSNLSVAFAVGAVRQLAFTNTTWLGKPSVLLLAGATAYVTVQAQDAFGNLVPSFSGQVTAVATKNSRLWVGSALLASSALSLLAGTATVRLNDSSSEVAAVQLLDSYGTNLTMPSPYSVPYSSGACVQYVVSSVLGSAYYDFPIVNPGTGIFTSFGSKGSDIALNISQSVQITIQCQDASGALDKSVQGVTLTATFSHNQTAVINGPCAFVNGSCALYVQSFTGGNVTVNVTESGSRSNLLLPAPQRILFKQLQPIVWTVSPQQLTTDGSSVSPQLITLTGQGFMCYQNFNTPPVVQLSDSNTSPTLISNCTVVSFNSTSITCLLPAGQGKPEVIVWVCGVRQLHLPRWSTDAYFYVFGAAPDWCTPMQNWWDQDGHTWHDNEFCTKYGHALMDIRFYQPPGINGQTFRYNLPTSNGQPIITTYSGYYTQYTNQPLYPVTSFPSVPAEVLVTHKCTQIQELLEPYNWPMIFLCLPKPAPYAWTLVRTGPQALSDCVPIREASDPYWSNGNHYMCTPLNTPYPEVDGIQKFYYQAPIISQLYPTTANCSGNVTLTLWGSSFGLNWTATAAQNNLNTVTVGGHSCLINPLRYNHSYLECQLPAGETLFNSVLLTVEGVAASNVPVFPYLPPVILSISPQGGDTQGGDVITLLGYNFGFSTAAITVGGNPCTLLSLSNTIATCSTPPGAGLSQAVFLTTNLQRNLQAYAWSYNPPSVYSVTPTSFDSAGGVTLTITGTSFGAAAAAAYVAGQLCPPSSNAVQNHTYLTCTLPGGQGYGLNVTVTQAGQSSVQGYQFGYLPPNITQSPSPRGAASGAGVYITLTGLSFGVSGLVLVNQAVCDWTSGGSWSHHQILCPLPIGNGSNVPVQVLVGGQQSNNASFYYSPLITALSAVSTYTAGGSLLTLSGVGFSQPLTVNDSVSIDLGIPCPVVSQSETLISCTLPPGQGTANSVMVRGVLNLTSNSFPFAYSPPSVISQLPVLCPAAGGVNVTLSGLSLGFGNATSLTLNSQSMALLQANHTALTFVAPSGSGTGRPLIVKVAGQTSVTWPFSYAPPNISRFSPAGGPTTGGYSLLLWGLNFGSASSNALVSVGGSLVQVSAHNDSFLNVSVPAQQGTVGVYVILDSQVSNTVNFVYDPPTLSSITPTNSTTAGGVYLTLTGASFGKTGAVSFYSQSTASSVQCVTGPAGYNQSSVQCMVPAGQGLGWQVYLTSGGKQTIALNFTYLAPTISSLQPTVGSTDGGSLVTISGSSFGSSGSVWVGGSPCTQSTGACQYSDYLIVCAVAAGQGTGYSTTISVSGQSVTTTAPALQFSYSPPSISSLSPAVGATSGGDSLTVFGSNFGSLAYVTFNNSMGQPGALNCSTTAQGQGGISCLTPAGQGPSTLVFVTVSGQVSAPVSFAYLPPVVQSVSPALVATAGTTVVTLTGTNFGLGYNLSLTAATLAGQLSITTTSVTYSSITFTMPRGIGTGVLLSLTVATQAATSSSGLPLTLSYSPPSLTSVSGSACTGQAGAVATGCSIQGGGSITLTGSNFGNNVTAINVTVGNATCAPVVLVTSDTQVSCLLAAAPYGGNLLPVTIGVAGQADRKPYLSFAGPLISSNSLQLLSPMGGSNVGTGVTYSATTGGAVSQVNVSDPTVAPLSVVSFQGTALSTVLAQLAIVYGPAGGSKLYTCTPVGALLLDVSSQLYSINCTLQVGVGSGLTFVIRVGLLTSPEGVDQLNYPQPAILPNTIRLSGQQPAHTAPGAKNPGDNVLFNVQNVGNTAQLLTVTFGPYPAVNGLLSLGVCGSVSLSVNQSVWTLSCYMPQGLSTSTGYVFQLQALNAYSVVQASQDTYTYPTSPVVFSVHGCSDAGNATALCPTYGGNQVLINGSSFSSSALDMSVRVGTAPCSSILALDHSSLFCNLQPGTGYSEPVTVTYTQLSSLPVNYVSYAAASISRVSGCSDVGNSTQDCPRVGGSVITVYGSGFGLLNSQPLLLVGGVACLNSSVQSPGSATSPSVLTCQLPSGSGTSLPLIFVQSGGPVTAQSAVLLSYAACPAGTFGNAANIACTTCPPGQFQDQPGSLSCSACPAGSVPSSASNATSCSACPAGFISAAGDSACTACSAGSYSSVTGSLACLDCGVGSFSNSTGAISCTLCPLGTAQSGLRSTSCTPCSAGQYAGYAGAVSCTSCPAGTESSSGQMTNCTDCPAGSFSLLRSASCTPCSTGSFAAVAHSTGCSSCDSGSFANVTGLSACFSCPAGSFSQKQGTAGATVCTPCAVGTYVDSSGQAACLGCPLGTYAPSTGYSACSACPMGYYSALPGVSACQMCSAGTYAALNGSVVCQQCPAGTFSAGTGSPACLACPAGQYQDQPGETACKPCDAGQANDVSGQPECVACNSGSYSNQTGVQVCPKCPAGQFSSRGEQSCQPCPLGSFSASAGQDACQLCPIGYFANSTGASACTACDAGTSTSATQGASPLPGASACWSCPPGTYSSQAGSYECLLCSAGSFALNSSSTTCTQCQAGSAVAGPASGVLVGPTICTACESGNFAGSTGQSACSACQAGSYGPFTNGVGLTVCSAATPGWFTNTTGLTAQLPCPAGTAQPASGQAACTPCVAGSYQPLGNATACISCPAGQAASSPSSLACAACQVGSYAAGVGSASCTLCPAGSYSSSNGSSSCQQCQAGSFSSSAGSSACSACPAGSFATSTGSVQCQVCPTGSFSPVNGSAACLACPMGSYQGQTGTTACVPCGNGTVALTVGLSACTNCPAGFVPSLNGVEQLSGSTFCTQCAPGSYLPNGGVDSCLLCPMGTFASSPGQSACTACPTGSASSTINATQCSLCPSGQYQPLTGQLTCMNCPAGSYSFPDGQVVCTLCGLGSFSAVVARNSSCDACEPGSFASSQGLQACLPCPVGSHASTGGSPTCAVCAAGSFANSTGYSDCLTCPAGQFQPNTSAVACQACPIGYFSSSDPTSCQPCPAGTFGNATGLASCLPCSPGTVQPLTAQTSCNPCPAGAVQQGQQQTSCSQCQPGYFSNSTGASMCAACMAGSYQDQPGSVGCQNCPLGTISSGPHLTACTPCTPGYFANSTGLSGCYACQAGTVQTQPSATGCVNCTVGSYQPSAAQTGCILCESGKFGTSNGSIACTNCPMGSISVVQGSVACQLCAVGSYGNADGLTSCTLCEAGKYQPTAGQASCTPCPAGNFSVAPGQSACQPCAPGKAQPAPGATTCLACSAGSFTDEEGQQQCESCGYGEYQSVQGQTFCLPCPGGQFGNVLGGRQCTQCPAGSFVNATGSTACTPCPAATYQPLQGQGVCQPCDVGTYSQSQGATQCVQCSRGEYQPSVGSGSCLPCPEGSYSSYLGQAACTNCTAGLYNDLPGQSTCYVCAAGTATALNGSTGCSDCQAGTVQPLLGQSSCSACPLGQYQPSTRSTKCIPCNAGTFANVTGLATCPACPSGSYQEQQGASRCTQCMAGFYNPNFGQTACVSCSRGTFTATLGRSGCDDCPLGYYGEVEAATDCPACDPGTFAAQSGQTSCDVCGTGTFAGNGSASCTDCPSGSYQSTPGQPACILCPAGQQTGLTTRNIQCSPCPSGSFSALGSASCTECPVGFYQPATGNDSCLPCPMGEYGAVTGASACSECNLGTFGNAVGLQSCFDCSAGQAQPLLSSVSCDYCSAGTYSSAPAAHNCLGCPPGSYTPHTNSTSCLPCPLGSFQNSSGQAQCMQCPPGQYADGTGSAYCKACPLGQFGVDTGAVQCELCPAGQYQSTTGQTRCLDCSIPTYAPTPGHSQCLACPQGQFGATTGQVQCSPCPAGLYQSNISATSCASCGPGFYSGVGAVQCEVCGPGQVTDEAATVACYACPPLTTVANFLLTKCLCLPGYYMPFYTPGHNNFTCIDCPLGADCTQTGTDWTNLASLPCFWRANNVSTNFYRCPICTNCPGGLAAGAPYSSQVDISTGGTYTDDDLWDATATPCQDHRGGILCSSCVTGYQEQTGGACVACPTGAGSVVLAAIVAIVLVSLLLFSYYLMLRSDRHLFENFDRQGPITELEREQQSSSLASDSQEDDSSSLVSDSDGDEEESSASSSQSSRSQSASKAKPEEEQKTADEGVPQVGSGKGAGGASREDESDDDDGSSSSSASSASSYSSDEDEGEGAVVEPTNALVTAVQFSGPPSPPENFTYKLKIMLSFLQIATALSDGLDIQWPALFKSFLLNFDVVNFQSILGSVTSSQCIGAVTYYSELMAILVAPLVGLALLVLLYILPSSFDLLCFRRQTLQSKLRTRMKVWKLFLYSLFLVFPSLSSNVLRLYVCTDIDGTQWLLTNLRVQCYTSVWYQYAYVAAPFILLYPVGIPLYFFVLLYSNRHALHERRVQAQLGFLYASYQRQLWWFEILDSIHKLILTSVLAFFPQETQLPLAMATVTAYSMVILTLQPFLSPSDDLLQLLALTELNMLCLAGWIYFNTPDNTFTGSQDTFVSIALIAIVVAFFCAFVFAFAWAFRRLIVKVYTRWMDHQQLQKDAQALREAEALKAKKMLEGEDDSQDKQEGADGAPIKPTKSFHFVSAGGGVATPSASAKVAPGLLSPIKVQPDDDGEEGDSGSGSEEDEEEDESEERAEPVPPLATPAGSKARDAWSSPPTPIAAATPKAGSSSARHVSPRPLAPSVSSRPGTANGGLSARQPSSSRLNLNPDEAAAQAAGDFIAPTPRSGKTPTVAEETKEEVQAEAASPAPEEAAVPPPPSLGAASMEAAAPIVDLPPVARGTRGLSVQRGSLAPLQRVKTRISSGVGAAGLGLADGGSAQSSPALMRVKSLAPLGPIGPNGSPVVKKKKRKIIRAGDNFQQGQAENPMVSPFKQLFNS